MVSFSYVKYLIVLKNVFEIVLAIDIFISRMAFVFLCSLLHTMILPKPNTLPSSRVQARQMLNSLGMQYNTYHACVNDCMLYRGSHEDDTTCVKCGEPRYKNSSETMQPCTIARKVLRHFPIIPRLRRLFRCPSLAGLMEWHSQNRSVDGIWRIPADCEAFQHIDRTWPDFSMEPRNLKCGIALDGINPFGMQSSNWSTWPIVLINYNIPPYIAIRKEHLMLTLLVPGNEFTIASVLFHD